MALGVIFTTLLVLAFTMFTAFKSVGFSRQRTEATALANQALEQIRALPADQLFMSMTDTAPADTALLPAGCVTAGTCTFNGRTVPMSNFGATPPTTPLSPTHIKTQTPSPGNSLYTVKSYLTIDGLDSTNQTRIATVQVSWSNPSQSGVSPNVQVESKLHTAAFDDAAPLTHTYTSSAVGTGAVVSVTGTMLNRTAVNLGLNFSATNAYFSGGVGGTNVGPTGNLISGGSAPTTLQAAGISVLTTGSSVATATNAAGTVTPDGPNSASASAATLNMTGTAGGLGGLGSLSVTSANSVGAAIAASKANGQTSIPSGNLLPTSHLGYGRATASQSGPVSVDLNLLNGLLALPLVSVTPAGNSTPDVATVAESTNTYTAAANKTFTEVDVLGGLLIPVVKLTGFSASASACASPTSGVCPASTAIEQGSLTILGITTNLLGHVAGSLGLRSTTVALGAATLAIGANATIGSSTATSPGSGSVSSPLTVDVTLQISTILTGTLVNLAIHVDLGSISTSAAYS